jgi:MoaA/NifB/PqqE/SkfB family radical SAM enzyme
MSTNDAAQVRNVDLQGQLDRIEDKLDKRLDRVEVKVDGVTSRVDRIEGGLGMLKWLGPTGVAALIAGVAKSMGIW